MSTTHITDIAFSSFALDPRLAQSLEEAGFSHCTPIQAETLPLSLAGKDVAGQAQTGTGKTGAFLVAVFQRLLQQPPKPNREKRHIRALMVAPTRELAVQIHKDALTLSHHTGLRLGVVYGGAGYESQAQTIRDGVDILIGTPGRLIDYFKQHLYSLKQVEAVVLDEADRMFDLGFIKDIRYLLRRLPPPQQRLGLLFSATLSFRVTELAYEHMNNPVEVEIKAKQITADQVREELFHTANEEKIPLLIGLLRHTDPARTIVFTNTKHAAERVCAYLKGNELDAGILSGDVPQKKRLSLLNRFQEGELPILVATDVAARGLHISDVSHVINYDLPNDPEDYVHRIGRTARFGSQGDAISFACENYAYSLPDIEEYIGHRIPIGDVDAHLEGEIAPPAKIERARRPGGRGKPGARKGGRSGGKRPPRRR